MSEVPVTSFQVNPPAEFVMVIEFASFNIEIPVPAVIVDALGIPPDEPIRTSPLRDNSVKKGTPIDVVVKTALLAVDKPATVFEALEKSSSLTVVEDNPVPPRVTATGVERVTVTVFPEAEVESPVPPRISKLLAIGIAEPESVVKEVAI